MSKTSLAISMRRDLNSGNWFVNRIEVNRRHIKTQTRFSAPMPLADVFHPIFADYLRVYMPTRLDPHVHSVTEQGFPELGIFCAELRVITQRALAGLQAATVRIADVTGAIPGLYSPHLHPPSDQPYQSLQDRHG